MAMTQPKTETKTEAGKMTDVYYMGSSSFVVPMYEELEKGQTGARKMINPIIINGGANVAYSDPEKAIRKSQYKKTTVSAEQLKQLEANPSFIRKKKAGFITIGEAPKVIKADKSAQLTVEAVAAKTKAKPSTGKEQEVK